MVDGGNDQMAENGENFLDAEGTDSLNIARIYGRRHTPIVDTMMNSHGGDGGGDVQWVVDGHL